MREDDDVSSVCDTSIRKSARRLHSVCALFIVFACSRLRVFDLSVAIPLNIYSTDTHIFSEFRLPWWWFFLFFCFSISEWLDFHSLTYVLVSLLHSLPIPSWRPCWEVSRQGKKLSTQWCESRHSRTGESLWECTNDDMVDGCFFADAGREFLVPSFSLFPAVWQNPKVNHHYFVEWLTSNSTSSFSSLSRLSRPHFCRYFSAFLSLSFYPGRLKISSLFVCI